jgi:hypothetical protein
MELKHLILFAALCLVGCQREQWDDCITSAGPLRSEVRTVGAFHTIDLDDRIDLVLEERPSNTIAVEAGSNLLGQIRAEVQDGTLIVRNGMKCNWVRSFKQRVTVHVPVSRVAKLTVRGTGDVLCADTIVRDRFELEQWSAQGSADLLLKVQSCSIALHTGAGDARVAGTCVSTADLFSGIQAPIDARALQARNVNVNNSGVADIRCWATERLDVQLRDVGDVYYRGDPAISSDITGSGALIRE